MATWNELEKDHQIAGLVAQNEFLQNQVCELTKELGGQVLKNVKDHQIAGLVAQNEFLQNQVCELTKELGRQISKNASSTWLKKQMYNLFFGDQEKKIELNDAQVDAIESFFNSLGIDWESNVNWDKNGKEQNNGKN